MRSAQVSVEEEGFSTPGETDLEHDLHLVEPAPGPLAGEHLDDKAADAPDVGLGRVSRLLADLGRHP